MTKTRIGILVARAIVQGDAQLARALACGLNHWAVCEVRAIIGATREANRRYGCALNPDDFLNWT